MEKVILKNHNSVLMKIDCSQSIQMELYDKFSFLVNNYKFHPKYKKRIWDGYIHLFNRKTKTIYKGLYEAIVKFCEERNYELLNELTELESQYIYDERDLESIYSNLPENLTVRDYQTDAILEGLNGTRRILLSPTGSGKSFIIYCLCRILKVKTLITVPSIQLVEQLYKDFEDYSSNDENWNVVDNVSQIMGGYDKNNLNKITISTWQSIFDMDKEWFDENQFKMIIGDECHLNKAKSLISIMEKLDDTPIRIGLTGTLDGTDINELVITGLFGPVKKIISTKTLIDEKYLSDLKVNCVILKYSDEDRKNLPHDYQKEIKFLIEHEKRNKFIINLSSALKGNTLVLFNRIEQHGKILFEDIKKANPDKFVYYISGEIKVEDREFIRKEVESKGDNCIICASVGTFAQGINIVNLHNLVLVHPSKSRIRLLQSIGRVLRKSGKKVNCTVYDIVDELNWKDRKNYAYNHFLARLRIYIDENFNYELKKKEL